MAFGHGELGPLELFSGPFLRLGSSTGGPSSIRPTLYAPAPGVSDGTGNKGEPVDLPELRPSRA
eukprot:3163052-Alexandrium_andersonii.AAC.1